MMIDGVGGSVELRAELGEQSTLSSLHDLVRRRLAGCFAAIALAIAPATATDAAARVFTQRGAQTVPQHWQGVKRLSVLCLVATDRGVDTGPLHDGLCRSVRDAAAEDAPVPVTVVGVGDRSLLAADAVTLLVHASTGSIDGRRVMAVAIRPFRVGGDDPGTTFAAAPRAVPLATDGQDQPALARAVRAMLAETLPWRRPSTADRQGVHPSTDTNQHQGE